MKLKIILIAINFLHFQGFATEQEHSPFIPVDLAIISNGEDAPSLRISSNSDEIATVSKTSLIHWGEFEYNSEKKILYVRGKVMKNEMPESVIAIYQDDKETLVELSTHTTGHARMCVTRAGMVFVHSLWCGCCVEQSALAIFEGKIQRISFPFKVGRVGFNQDHSELSFIGNPHSITLKVEGDEGQLSVTARVFLGNDLHQFTSLEWPKTLNVGDELDFKPDPLAAGSMSLIHLNAKEHTSYEIPSEYQRYEDVFLAPMYTKISEDGTIFHVSSYDGENFAPLLTTIRNGVVLANIPLPLKAVNDLDGYRNTIVVCGQSLDDKKVMLVVIEGKVTQTVELKMAMIYKVNIDGDQGKVDGYPNKFKFSFDENADISLNVGKQ